MVVVLLEDRSRKEGRDGAEGPVPGVDVAGGDAMVVDDGTGAAEATAAMWYMDDMARCS